MASRTISVEIVGDADSLTKAFNKVEGASKSLGGKLMSFGKVAALGLAAVGAGAAVAGKKMLDLAGDAEETDSKLNVVFGKQLPALKKNLDAFSDATGASSFKLREQAADLGALLGPLTGSTKATSQMSEKFVKLATDLSSFNNVPVDDALLAIRSGLVGEAEPLRRFGVLLNEASVSAEAHRLGLVKGKEALTEQQKVMARGSLIMQQTTKAQGDAIRTSGSYTNSVRALKNTITDLATNMGSKLIPAATAVASGLNDFINKISQADGAGAKFRVAMDALKTIATTAAAGIISAVQAIDWTAAWNTLVTSAKDVGVRLRDALSVQLGAVDWSGVGAKITAGITSSIESVGAVGKKLAEAITAAVRQIDWNEVGRVVGPGLAAAIVTAFATLTDISFWIKNWDLALAVAITAFSGPIGKVASKLARPLIGLSDDIVLLIAGGIERASPRLAAALTAMALRLPGILLRVLTNTLPDVVERVFGSLGKIAVFTVKVVGVLAVINAVKNLAQKVIDILTGLIGTVAGLGQSIGHAIVQGILGGITSLPGQLADKLQGYVTGAISKVGGILRGSGDWMFTKHVVGEPMAQGILEGFINGMQKVNVGMSRELIAMGNQLAAIAERRAAQDRAAAVRDAEASLAEARKKKEGVVAAEQALARAREDIVVAGLEKAIAREQATLDKRHALVQAKMDKLNDMIRRAQEKQLAIFDKIRDKILRAFDAIRGDIKTPAEAALEALNDNARQRDLQRALADALTSGDAEAILRAQEDIQRDSLERQATTERLALDQQTEALRESLTEKLQVWKGGTDGILKLLEGYGIDFASVGALLGDAFRNSLIAAIQGTKTTGPPVLAGGGGGGGGQRAMAAGVGVGTPIVMQVVLDKKVIAEAVRTENALYSRSNGPI